MSDNKFYFSVVAIVVVSLFFGFLVYIVWRQQSEKLITTADIEKARAIVRGLERD